MGAMHRIGGIVLAEDPCTKGFGQVASPWSGLDAERSFLSKGSGAGSTKKRASRDAEAAQIRAARTLEARCSA
jgi:hypothetical protein